jgi:hypothetical protein
MMNLTSPYQAIQEWWGEPLGRELAKRILESPHDHIEEFVRFVSELPTAEVPELDTGVIRPLLKSINSNIHKSSLSYINTALSLLLYAEEVVIEDPIPNLGYRPDLDRKILSCLLQAQPLADANLIKFITYSPRLYHPSRAHAFTSNLIEILPELPDGLEIAKTMAQFEARTQDYDLGVQIFAARSALGTSLGLAQENLKKFNVLIESAEEALLLPIGIYRATLAAADIQTTKLAKLAALNLPRLDGNAIWAVRKSSEEFAAWRAALGSAVHDIDLISSGEQRWQAEAKGVIAAELRPMQDKINRAVKKSPALSSLRIGAVDMGYSAVGAATGALMGGSIVTGLVGAASGKSAEVVVNYLRNLRERRQGRAVLDLIVSFYPPLD